MSKDNMYSDTLNIDNKQVEYWINLIMRQMKVAKDREDIAQECRIDIYKALLSYDETKGAISTYVTRVIRHAISHYYRHHAYGKRNQGAYSYCDYSDVQIEDPDNTITLYEQYRDFIYLISILRTTDQQLMIWRYLLGYSSSEIAEMLKTTANCVTSRFTYLFTKMEKYYESNNSRY